MLFLTLSWGMNWAVLKIGAAQLPPLWFRVTGLLLGTAILGVVLVLRRVPLRLPRGAFGTLVAISLPNIVLWYALVTIAITMLPAGRAAILGFSMPAWAALIGYVVYRERLSWPMVGGVVAAIAGVILLISDDLSDLAAHPLGVTLMLVASIGWGFGTHLLNRAKLSMDTLALTFWMMLIACPWLLAMSAVLELPHWRMPHGVEWWPILYNAVIVLAMGNLIWFTVARTLPPVAAGLSSMLIPVVGVFSGFVMLGEQPGWRDYGALVLVSIAVGVGLLPKPGRR